ncbi:MAG: DNA polymerase III subunit delta [Deltaproteobacteria bacterium]|jgi:DNA polymerase-3 subunit delta|nr:DNA polymerase III subunit delta [Deltaproteobacteria bacterium]
MEPASFRSEIGSPERKPFYVIAGGDPSAVSLCLEAARKAVDPSFLMLNFRQYSLEDLNETSWSALAPDLSSSPFGNPPKIVIVSLSESEKLNAENLERISKIRPNIAKGATLVLAQLNPVDSRLKFFKEVVNSGLLVDCKAPTVYGLPNWLIAKFNEKGLRIGLDAAKAMIGRAGSNLGVLLGEIDKLAIFPGPDMVITSEHVRLMVSMGSTAKAYELGAPLGYGRLDKAIPILMDLLDVSQPVELASALATHFRRLLRFRVALDNSEGQVSDETMGAAMGIQPYAVKFLREQLDLWSIASLGEAISAIQSSIRSMISGNAPHELALEALAVKIASLSRGAPGASPRP